MAQPLFDKSCSQSFVSFLLEKLITTLRIAFDPVGKEGCDETFLEKSFSEGIDGLDGLVNLRHRFRARAERFLESLPFLRDFAWRNCDRD